MKRNATLLLALGLLVSLLGCKKPTEDRIGSMIPMSKDRFGVFAAETKDTLYFLSHNNTYIGYMDKITGIGGPLCSRPECRHNSKDCNAYAGPVEGLLVSNGRLYWVGGRMDGTMGNYLQSIALDGTDRREHMELPRELYPSSHNGMSFALQDDLLYMGTCAGEVRDGESVNVQYVAAFPLNSKQEPFVILREDTMDAAENLCTFQPYGGSLYILTNSLGPLPAEGDTEGAEITFRIRQWNPETGELETLYEKITQNRWIADTGELLFENGEYQFNRSGDLWITDESLFFSRQAYRGPGLPRENWVYRCDFETGECETVCENGIYDWSNMSMLAENLIAGYRVIGTQDGICDFYVNLKDFKGNVLVDETYSLDFRDAFPGYDPWSPGFQGRDEKYAYFSFCAHDLGDEKLTIYTSIVAIALDGSGAQVMCTQMEECV